MPPSHVPSTPGRRALRRLVAGARVSAVAATVGVSIGACGAPGRPSGTVVVASGADLESANPLVTVHPLARQVQRFALFVTLARYDSALAPVPYFARSWSWSADRRSLTFALVPTLRWHDGVRTTSRDVAFTLDAARDPATGFPRAADLASLDSVVVHDDTLVTLRFARPLARFPSILCELPLVPAHLLGGVRRADFRRHPFATAPVGNGPYRFVERLPGQRWVFARVADFPVAMGGPPTVERVIVAVVDEPTTKFAGLVSGDLDLAGIAPTMAGLVRRDPVLALVSYPVAFSTALVFNVARPPFDDARVRRAIDAAIDRRRIVDVALAGFGTPARGPVPPEHPFADSVPTVPAVDSSAVNRLLDSAGWVRGPDALRRRGGDPLRFTLLTVGSGDNALEQLVQGDLRRYGVTVDIRQMELGAFLVEARARPKRFDALVTGIPGDVALSQIAAMFEGRQAGGALDYAGFHEAGLDSLFAAAREAPRPEAEAFAWREVQRELARQVPVAWLYHARGVQGINRRLHDVRMDLRGELATLAQWSLTPDRGSP